MYRIPNNCMSETVGALNFVPGVFVPTSMDGLGRTDRQSGVVPSLDKRREESVNHEILDIVGLSVL
jgi:hypothetical protein